MAFLVGLMVLPFDPKLQPLLCFVTPIFEITFRLIFMVRLISIDLYRQLDKQHGAATWHRKPFGCLPLGLPTMKDERVCRP